MLRERTQIRLVVRQRWLGFGGSANLGLPASNGFRKCKWMRHEVISNIFGGSASALSRFRNAWIGYLNATVPTNANMGTPTAEKTCNCPSEELLFTTMANDHASDAGSRWRRALARCFACRSVNNTTRRRNRRRRRRR